MQKKLMVKTKDNRTFFTNQKNLPMLIEFAKTFNAQIFTVETEETHVLELNKLAHAFCDQNYTTDAQCVNKVKIYPVKDAAITSKWSKRIIDANQIRTYIRERLLSHDPVSLKELKTHFADMNLTDACLSNHFTQVRKNFKPIVKIGAGSYQLQ